MPTIRITKKDGTVQVKQHFGADYLLFNPQMLSGAQRVEIFETRHDGIYTRSGGGESMIGREVTYYVIFEGRVVDRIFSHQPNAENLLRDLEAGKIKPTYRSDLHLSDFRPEAA